MASHSALRFSLRCSATERSAVILTALALQPSTSSRRSIGIIERIVFSPDFKALLTGCVLSIPFWMAARGARVKIDPVHVSGQDCPSLNSSR